MPASPVPRNDGSNVCHVSRERGSISPRMVTSSSIAAQARRRSSAAACATHSPRRRGATPPPECPGCNFGMKDFWFASGHHLLDRDAAGRLRLTDEFLKAYLARPELLPPDDACEAELRLHHELLMHHPRRPVEAAEIATIADADARENWR